MRKIILSGLALAFWNVTCLAQIPVYFYNLTFKIDNYVQLNVLSFLYQTKVFARNPVNHSVVKLGKCQQLNFIQPGALELTIQCTLFAASTAPALNKFWISFSGNVICNFPSTSVLIGAVSPFRVKPAVYTISLYRGSGSTPYCNPPNAFGN